MRTLLTAAAALALTIALGALPSPAGEGPQDPAKAKARAQRMAEVKERIGFLERSSAEATQAIPAMRAKGKDKDADWNQKRLDKWQAEKSALTLELRWLSGDLTSAKATSAAKAAEEALAKSPDADKPKAQAALDAARKELEAVKTLEAKGEF